MSPARRPRDGPLPPRGLIIALLALPQIAETILAPALPDLARHWRVDAGTAQSVMGVFFLGFAVGVLLWGHLADAWGRRPALLGGLATGLAGTLAALLATRYELLLLGRFIQALGLATCSVTTQTLLRDRLSGAPLTRYFVTLGAVLAWSPALGPLAAIGLGPAGLPGRADGHRAGRRAGAAGRAARCCRKPAAGPPAPSRCPPWPGGCWATDRCAARPCRSPA